MNKGILFYAFLLMLACLTSCNVSKRIPKDKFLLRGNKVTLKNSNTTISESDLSTVVNPKPNQKILGIPLRLLVFDAIDSMKVAQKREKKDAKILAYNQHRLRRMDHINTRRIKKARKRHQEYYSEKILPLKDATNPRKFLRQWLKYTYGEAPVLYDSTMFKKTEQQMRLFLQKKGFYHAKIEATISLDSVKRYAYTQFVVSPGDQLHIDSMVIKGPKNLVDLYKQHLKIEEKRAALHPLIGRALDEDHLIDHSNKAARYLRDFGFYGFNAENLAYLVDTFSHPTKNVLTVEFLPRKVQHPSIKDSLITKPFEAYTINRVIFHLCDTNSLKVPWKLYRNLQPSAQEVSNELGFISTYQKLLYKEILCDKPAMKRFKLTKNDFNPYRIIELNFNGDKPGIKPSLLEMQNFLEPTNIFKDKYLERSYQYLNQINLFSTVKPVLVENHRTLDVHYYCVRSKIQAFAFEPRFTSSFGLLGLNASLNYTHKNLFRGGEKLTITLGGGFDSQPIVFNDGLTESKTFNTFEIGPMFKLEVPGLIPVPYTKLSKRQKPTTVISVGANIERRDIFQRRVLQMGYTWKWLVGKTQVFTVGLPGISTLKFVKFDKSETFSNQINALNDLFLRNSYSDQLIWEDFKFDYQWTNVNKEFSGDKKSAVRKVRSDLRFTNTTVFAGNVLAKFKERQDTLSGGVHTVFGNAYAQFFRTDNQFTAVKKLKLNLEFAGKLALGVGVPYGNSKTSMPYDYSFFAGGANDNRGWKPRSLGPGNYNRSIDSTGTQTQLGDIRIFGSLEFRFPIKSIFNGCIFTDFGNIWTSKKDNNRPGAEFSKDFYKQLAWSIGTGIRIDLSILVFRLDFGFPIFNPSVPEESRWIFNSRDAYYLKGAEYYGLNTGSLEEQISNAKEILPKPFRPCINFGIGLPF